MPGQFRDLTALRKQEKSHLAAKDVLRKVKDGSHIAIEPYTVLIEVTAALKRRTGSKELALRVRNDLLAINTISFMGLDAESAADAAEIAAEIGVRGMDAIVIQVAKEFDIPLVTLDQEMLEKAKLVVDVMDLNYL
ncbi:MAG: PIN domain-containing protein [Methanosarcina sp.]|uniref:PIN domain-containing protein n=1 Tax=Methanosarcina sp. TaxID=2213 RepID=UPI0026386D08|nr:PIN domain-containing protein [Methanosarcina sp.]MDD3245381.1 PIN domain-containing protein [Methanosarcina sp.]